MGDGRACLSLQEQQGSAAACIYGAVGSGGRWGLRRPPSRCRRRQAALQLGMYWCKGLKGQVGDEGASVAAGAPRQRRSWALRGEGQVQWVGGKWDGLPVPAGAARLRCSWAPRGGGQGQLMGR